MNRGSMSSSEQPIHLQCLRQGWKSSLAPLKVAYDFAGLPCLYNRWRGFPDESPESDPTKIRLPEDAQRDVQPLESPESDPTKANPQDLPEDQSWIPHLAL